MFFARLPKSLNNFGDFFAKLKNCPVLNGVQSNMGVSAEIVFSMPYVFFVRLCKSLNNFGDFLAKLKNCLLLNGVQSHVRVGVDSFFDAICMWFLNNFGNFFA